MTIISRLALAGALLAGCNNQDLSTGDQSQALSTPDFAVAHVARVARNQNQVTEKLSRLAETFEGSLGLTPSIRAHQATVVVPGRAVQTRFDVDIGEEDKLKGRFESRDDSFEVFDSSIRPASATGADLSLEAATAAFNDTFGRLVASGVIDPSHIRRSDVITRIVRAAEGDTKGARRSWIDEHIFFVPLTIEGVRVGTPQGEYGLYINVHRSGKVRRVALSGAGIAGDEPGALAVSRGVKRAARTTPAEIVARAQFGESEIRSLGLRYLVNEDAGGAEDLIARDLFSISPTGTGPNGEIIHSKAYIGSYAINDPSDALEIAPKPGSLGPNPVLSK